MLNLIISFLLLLPGCNNLDIIVLADYSGSVKGHERFLHKAISTFSEGLDISPDNVNLGIVTFNAYSEVLCPLEDDRRELGDRIALLANYEGEKTTNLSSAFYSAFDEFSTHGREGYKKIIIVISDGQPDYPEDTYKAAEQVKMVGIQIFTILIQDGIANSDYMRSISSDGCFFSSDYGTLTKTLSELNLCL